MAAVIVTEQTTSDQQIVQEPTVQDSTVQEQAVQNVTILPLTDSKSPEEEGQRLTSSSVSSVPVRSPKSSGRLATLSPNLRSSLKQTIVIVMSLGLHTALMFWPMQNQRQEVQPPKESPIRIAQAPGKKKPKPVLPKPKPKVTITRQVPPRPQAAPPPPPVPPSPSPEANPSPNAKDTKSEKEAESDTWEDFPKYPQATTGCFGLEGCSETSDALEKVAAFFIKELPAKKYTATPTVTEADRKALQVTKGSLTQILSLLVDPTKGKIYIVLSDKPLKLSDLNKASEVPPEVFSVLQNLGAAEATIAAFSEPTLYFEGDKLRSDLLVTQLVEGYAASDVMETFFRQNLINDGFDVSDPVGSYGNGEVYEITKGELKLFVNVVPSKDSSSAIVAIFKKSPL